MLSLVAKTVTPRRKRILLVTIIPRILNCIVQNSWLRFDSIEFFDSIRQPFQYFASHSSPCIFPLRKGEPRWRKWSCATFMRKSCGYRGDRLSGERRQAAWLSQWRKVGSWLSIKYDNTPSSINVICVSHVRLGADATSGVYHRDINNAEHSWSCQFT